MNKEPLTTWKANSLYAIRMGLVLPPKPKEILAMDMMNFIGNPNTQKIEVINGDPGTGLYSYRYDLTNIGNNDIRQILNVTEIILGTLEDTKLIFEPVNSDFCKVILSIKNRSNIELGHKDLKLR